MGVLIELAQKQFVKASGLVMGIAIFIDDSQRERGSLRREPVTQKRMQHAVHRTEPRLESGDVYSILVNVLSPIDSFNWTLYLAHVGFYSGNPESIG
jgi:hypothetical protein